MQSKPVIAYFSSEYPAISHTFIFREICELRSAGFKVCAAAVNPTANLEKMTDAEKTEARQTLVIKRRAIWRVAADHLTLLWQAPKKYLAMAKQALNLMRRGPKSPVKALAYLAEAGVLLRWMQQSGAGHAHVHFANPAATVALVASAYGSIDFSISVHGPDIFYNIEENLLPQKVRHARFIRCISFYSRSQLMRISDPKIWDKLHIVRCGIDPDVYRPRAQPANTVPRILCVGRLVPAKGQHILIKACARLRDQGTAFHLCFVGDGPDRASLETMTRNLELSEHVTFTGALGQTEVHAHYDQADIFVLASFAEGVPVVLMESMAKQIASVSTRITGIGELIEHGQDGLLAAASDDAELAQQLAELIDKPQWRRQLGLAGRQKVLDQYNLSNNCQRMCALFDQYVGMG